MPDQDLARQQTLTVPDVGRYYWELLKGPRGGPLFAVTGIFLGLVGFIIAVPVVSQTLLTIMWLMRGEIPPFRDYSQQAMNYELVDGLIATHAAIACLIPISMLLVRYLHKRDRHWLSSIKPGLRWNYLLMVVGAVALISLALLPLQSGPDFSLSSFATPEPQLVAWLVAIVAFTPFQAAAEEYFFRGYMLQAIGSATKNAWLAVVVTALIFAFFHGVQNPALFIDRFAFGILAGILVIRTGGLEAAIAIHIVNNVLAFGLAALTGTMVEVKGLTEISWLDAVADIGSFALLGLVAWLIARKTHRSITVGGTVSA